MLFFSSNGDKDSENEFIKNNKRITELQTTRQRSNSNDSDYNYRNNNKNSEQLIALQEMCQQFKNIINQLEDKIIELEKLNRNLEIDNETLSYKVMYFFN